MLNLIYVIIFTVVGAVTSRTLFGQSELYGIVIVLLMLIATALLEIAENTDRIKKSKKQTKEQPNNSATIESA